MTRQARTIVVALALLVGIGAGLGGVRPQTALAADPALTVAINGPNSVYSWESQQFVVTIDNDTQTVARDIFVEIYDHSLPHDYRSISARIGTRALSGCRVTNGVGAATKTRATCSVNQLNPGERLRITLSTSTTVVIGTDNGILFADAYSNFPANTTRDGTFAKLIAKNP